jgi:hypothetical protein
MVELLGDNVSISSIHGGEEECGFGCAVNQQRLWFTTGIWGEHLPTRYYLNRYFQDRAISDGTDDGKPLMMRRKLASRNFRPVGFQLSPIASTSAYCIHWSLLAFFQTCTSPSSPVDTSKSPIKVSSYSLQDC